MPITCDLVCKRLRAPLLEKRDIPVLAIAPLMRVVFGPNLFVSPFVYLSRARRDIFLYPESEKFVSLLQTGYDREKCSL
jgi:hypothetical protein